MLYYNQILDSILLSTCFLSIRKGFLFLFETNCLSASLSSCNLSFWVGEKNIIVANFDMFSQKPTYIKQIKSKINKPTRLQISGWRWMEIKIYQTTDKKIESRFGNIA